MVDTDTLDVMILGKSLDPSEVKSELASVLKSVLSALAEVESSVGKPPSTLPTSSSLDLYSVFSHLQKATGKAPDFGNLEKYGQAFLDKLSQTEKLYEMTMMPE